MKTNTNSTDLPENRRGRNTSFHEAIVTLIPQPKTVQKKKTIGQCHEYRHKNPDNSRFVKFYLPNRIQQFLKRVIKRNHHCKGLIPGIQGWFNI